MGVDEKGETLEKITANQLFNTNERRELILKTSKFNDYIPEYYQTGGVLYPSSEPEAFYKAIENTLDKIIHSDLEYLRQINVKIENDVHKLLEIIAISPAGEANYSNIASNLSISKPTLIKVISDLEKIGLVKRISPCGRAIVRKEPKLYLSFPFRAFFNYVLQRQPDKGALREEFFANHADNICYVKGNRGEKTPDFSFSGKTVEIGGPGKTFHQKPDYIITDGVPLEENKIPLYLTGFLY